MRLSASAAVGSGILLVLVMLALAGPVLTTHDPQALDLSQTRMPPSLQHPLGTDMFGRDVLSRVIYSLRFAYAAGLIVVMITGGLGTALGLTAAHFGGTLDNLLMRVVDMWLSLPGILFLLVAIAVMGRGTMQVILAVAFLGIPGFARTVRGVTLDQKAQPYIEAAHAIGVPGRRIVARHIVPNILPVLATLLARLFGEAILAAGVLSFLGLGGDPSIPELGSLLKEGQDAMRWSWWLIVGPLIILWLTMFGANLISDGISERR